MVFRPLGWICQSRPSGRGTGRDREIEFLSPSLSTQLIGRDSEIAPTVGARFPRPMTFRPLVWICQSSPSGRGVGRDREIPPTVRRVRIAHQPWRPPFPARWRLVRWSGFANPDGADAVRVGIGRLNFYRLRYPLS